jgi:MFS family permease
MAMLVLPAVAPDAARDYGLDPALIGYQISLLTIGLMASLLCAGNVSRRLGACRANQIGQLVLAAAMLMLLVPSLAAAVAGSLAIGVGYGLLAPSASALLVRFTPPPQRNMVFSIQQTGVPFGGMMAALIAPALAVTYGWRSSLIATALMLVAAAAVMQRGRAALDDDRDAAAPLVPQRPFEPLALIWRERRLRYLALVGGCFSWGQFVVASFSVVAGVTTLGLSLIAAGTLLIAVQVGSASGRLLAGWLADKVGSSRRVLVWVAWLMVGSAGAALWLAATWPLSLAYTLFALLGVATGAWAGLVLADVGRRAPPAQVSAAIGGALVYVNIGKFIGPATFANVYLATHDYGYAFASLTLPGLAALYLLRRLARQ